MIDPIGVKPSTVQGGRVESRETAKVASIEPVRAPEAPVVAQTSARETAKAMAAQPPIDFERVQQIKRALQEGRFPITPTKIADRLIAAQFSWMAKK
jgi:negative regulator of flagellin synthesis FlgM